MEDVYCFALFIAKMVQSVHYDQKNTKNNSEENVIFTSILYNFCLMYGFFLVIQIRYIPFISSSTSSSLSMLSMTFVLFLK